MFGFSFHLNCLCMFVCVCVCVCEGAQKRSVKSYLQHGTNDFDRIFALYIIKMEDSEREREREQ